MSVPAFDTLKFVRTLRDAGIDPKQAEATAEAFAAAVSQELATKTDVRELEQRLSARIDALSAETKARFDQIDGKFREIDGKFREFELRQDTKLRELELRLTLKLGGMLVAAIAAVAAVIRLIGH